MSEPQLRIFEHTRQITDDLLGRDGLRQLYRAWNAARERRGGKIPAWADLDPAEFSACLANLMLLDVLDDGADYRYVIYGSDIARHFGHDMTGRRTSELPGPATRLFVPLYQQLLADRQPFFSRTEAAPSITVAQWDRLILPLSADGVTVTGIVGGNYPFAWRTPPGDDRRVLQTLNHLDEGICIFDSRREVLIWNEAYVRISGIAPRLCAPGVPLRAVIEYFAERGDYGPGDRRAQVAERMARLEATPLDESLAREEREREDGRVVEVRRAVLPDGGFSTIWTDVTRRRRNEAELARHRDRLEELVEQRTEELAEKTRTLQSILDYSPAPINLKDPQGRYILVNRRFAEARGYPEEEILGKTAHDFFPASLVEDFEAAEQRVFATRAPVHEEAEIPRAGGINRHVLVSRFPVLGADGEVTAVGMMAFDITERRRIEAELERHREDLEALVATRSNQLASAQAELLRSEKLAAIGTLMATVSHELRNPLATIRSSLSALRVRLDAPSEKVGATLDRIERNVVRCMRITHELLDFARERPLVVQCEEIDAWLRRTLDELEVPEGGRMDVRLASGAFAMIDRERLRQALVNVVDNAWQAMQGEGQGERRVFISAERARNRVEIVVRDSGPGIAEEALDKLFEPLYSTKPTGIGLGLPLVRRIIEQHGGGIEVGNAAEGGARVLLWLPESVPAGEPAPAVSPRDDS